MIFLHEITNETSGEERINVPNILLDRDSV